MRSLLLFIFIANFILAGAEEESITKLKAWQPNWRLELTETYPSGYPKTVRLYAPSTETKEEIPVKEMTYYSDCIPATEADLIVIDKSDQAFAKFGKTTLLH